MSADTGLTVMLFDSNGNAVDGCDWQEAAERIVQVFAERAGGGNDAADYARAHRILQTVFPRIVSHE